MTRNERGYRVRARTLKKKIESLKSSLDALDRLYRPDRGGFLGTVSNNSLTKRLVVVNKNVLRPQGGQKIVSRAYFGMFSIPNRLSKSQLRV